MKLMHAKLIINETVHSGYRREINTIYLDESIVGTATTGVIKGVGILGSGIKRVAINASDSINNLKRKKCLRLLDPYQKNACLQKFQ